MPCYIDERHLEHYGGLFWPQPYAVRLVFGPTALHSDVTEDEIEWVMSHEPEHPVHLLGVPPTSVIVRAVTPRGRTLRRHL